MTTRPRPHLAERPDSLPIQAGNGWMCCPKPKGVCMSQGPRRMGWRPLRCIHLAGESVNIINAATNQLQLAAQWREGDCVNHLLFLYPVKPRAGLTVLAHRGAWRKGLLSTEQTSLQDAGESPSQPDLHENGHANRLHHRCVMCPWQTNPPKKEKQAPWEQIDRRNHGGLHALPGMTPHTIHHTYPIVVPIVLRKRHSSASTSNCTPWQLPCPRIDCSLFICHSLFTPTEPVHPNTLARHPETPWAPLVPILNSACTPSPLPPALVPPAQE